MAKKKTKKSPEQMHRQVQDNLQGLPRYIEQQKGEGKRVRAFMLQYVSTPMLRLMNRVMNATRYRGEEGGKRKQTDQMRRRVEQKQAAIRHVQQHTPKAKKRAR